MFEPVEQNFHTIITNIMFHQPIELSVNVTNNNLVMQIKDTNEIWDRIRLDLFINSYQFKDRGISFNNKIREIFAKKYYQLV